MYGKQTILRVVSKKVNIDTTLNSWQVRDHLLMVYPRCFSRLSACEVVNTLLYSQDVIQENLLLYMVLNLKVCAR